jgi:tetrahydromethanopterin S-methyltransferase subunit A
MVPDPAGFFVVYPGRLRGRLWVEHYDREGVLACVLEGETPAAIWSAATERRLLSRLDHAAYLGYELARAERCLRKGEPYVQGPAPGTLA